MKIPLIQIIKEYGLDSYISNEPITAGNIVNNYIFEIGKYEDHSIIMNALKLCNDIKYIISYRATGKNNKEANIRFFGRPTLVGLNILLKWLDKIKPKEIYVDLYTLDGKLIESKKFDNKFEFYKWLGL